jgi:hypothetical protein
LEQKIIQEATLKKLLIGIFVFGSISVQASISRCIAKLTFINQTGKDRVETSDLKFVAEHNILQTNIEGFIFVVNLTDARQHLTVSISKRTSDGIWEGGSAWKDVPTVEKDLVHIWDTALNNTLVSAQITCK